MKKEAIESVVYASAFGDAYGGITEFMKHSEILKKKVSVPDELVITDDTQMALYTMDAVFALLSNGAPEDVTHVRLQALEGNASPVFENSIRSFFATFYLMYMKDPDNNRAPGNTVMNSLFTLDSLIHSGSPQFKNNLSWREGARFNNSKGCGTIMRSPWLGLLPLDEKDMFYVACLSAQITHNHPASWFYAGLGAMVVYYAFHTGELLGTEHMLALLDDFVALFSCENKVKNEIIRDIHTYHDSRGIFVDTADTFDICKIFGGGWVADEAFWNAYAIADVYRDKPYEGIKRGVYSSGDSDSIACIAGSFLGAINPKGTLLAVEPYVNRFEDRYQSELSSVIALLEELHQK